MVDLYAVKNNPLKQKGYIGCFFNRTFRKKYFDSKCIIKIFDTQQEVDNFLAQQNNPQHFDVKRLKGIKEKNVEKYLSQYFCDLVPTQNPEENPDLLPRYREVNGNKYKYFLDEGESESLPHYQLKP